MALHSFCVLWCGMSAWRANKNHNKRFPLNRLDESNTFILILFPSDYFIANFQATKSQFCWITYIVSFLCFLNLVTAYVCCLIICNGLAVRLTHFHERFQFICNDNCCVKGHTHSNMYGACTAGEGCKRYEVREKSHTVWSHDTISQ